MGRKIVFSFSGGAKPNAGHRMEVRNDINRILQVIKTLMVDWKNYELQNPKKMIFVLSPKLKNI